MNKIKNAIDTIELPEELSSRSVMGVKKARKLQKAPSRNIFRYGAIFGALAASLLFLGVLFTDFLPPRVGLDFAQDSRVSEDSQDKILMESLALDDADREEFLKGSTRENLYRLVLSGEEIFLEEFPYSNYLVINAFNLDRTEEGVNVEVILEAGENIIMFQDRFYIEVREWSPEVLEYYEESTTIFVFQLEGNRLVYRGRGEFPVRLINSWEK